MVLNYNRLVTFTTHAILVKFKHKACWVPKSIASYNRKDKTINIEDWFIRKKELICTKKQD